MLKGIAKGAALSAALPGVSGGRATICIVSSGVKASKDKKEKKTTEPLGKVKHAEHIGQCSKAFRFGRWSGRVNALTTILPRTRAARFGVLTEIDIQATMKKKLGEEMDGYRILGACNPKMAHQALEIEPREGLRPASRA